MDRNLRFGLRQPVMRPMLALAMAALLSGCAAVSTALLAPVPHQDLRRLEEGDFHLDKTHAALVFRIDHLGFSDFVGRFEAFDARLSGDPANPQEARIEAIVEIDSLDIANPGFAEELKGPRWFDAGRYPQAVFTSNAVRLTGERTALIDGDLTLRGIRQPVTLEARLNASAYDRLRGADVAGFSASLRLNRSDFGIDRFAGLIADEVRLEIEAEFIRSPPATRP